VSAETLPTPSSDPSSRLSAAAAIVHRNVLWTLGACFVPVPALDLVVMTAIQVKMMAELSALYGVPFREALARKLVLSLLATVGGLAAGVVIALSLGKAIPGVGMLLGFASVQLFSGAFTHATGRVYIMHLETGGTLLDFDPRAVREHFRREFAAGKGVARDLRATAAAASAGPSAAPPVSPVATTALASGVTISKVHSKGSVKRTQADEYAEITNAGDVSVDLSGWTLDAEGTGQVFTFPAGTQLAPGQVIRVYTDEVHPATGGFKFGIRRAIWNDRGDRARLHDAGGALVSSFTYGNKR
jgi:uncharacterized protein (DUF697 family)